MEIRKINEEIIRKHTFRVYVHVNDEIVDTRTVTGHIPKTKIVISDEDCAGAHDGECYLIIDYAIEIHLFWDVYVSEFF